MWLLLLPLLAGVDALRLPHSTMFISSFSAVGHQTPLPFMMAKKGAGKRGGKGKKGGPKTSGFEWASNFNNKPFERAPLRELVEAAVSGFQTKTGHALHASLVGTSDLPKAVWHAPIACMITSPAEGGAGEGETPDGSTVLYANAAALEAHGLPANDFDRLIGKTTLLPSTMAGERKFDSDYSKKLKPAAGAFSFTGTRWLVEKMAVVGGKLAMKELGVCYTWEEWVAEDGTICEPGGVRRAPELSEAELEAAIPAQAQAVRELKEGRGLTNQDPLVVEAVAELKRLRALLEAKQAE
ncbi:hypothetical protein AB1Y20_001471 [Prymnesium parvum]|uniref:MEKHLA domain-containing protein n=1 Tax=Prymnesium parvum TaxID=97485 RepID=A0AB34K8S7_PRYPA